MASEFSRRRGKFASAAATSAALLLSSVAAFAGPPAMPAAPQGPLPDLVVGASRLTSSLRISNKTFGSNSCSVVEGCVVAGSRRVLEFDTQIINYGNADAVLGTPTSRPDLFVFSPCHGHYHMLDSLDYSMAYGGLDTVSLYDNATGNFFLANKNASGAADVVYGFGAPGLVPISGDWNADGKSTNGVYDPSTGAFFLKNSAVPGPADVVLTFGAGGQGFVPVTGDWDGDGDDTIGLYHPASGSFFLRNTNSNGPADIVFGYGAAGAGFVPVAGDWNSDDFDSVGLYSPATGTYFLKNTNAGGGADIVFSYGPGGSFKPVVGDWNGSGDDTIGVYDPATGTYFLKNSNAAGAADMTFTYGGGGANMLPISGDWDYDQAGVTLPGIVGLKQAFCWLDSARVQGNLPGKFNCSNQGITAGWSDVYGRGLDCQWVDIPGLAAGNYQLRVSVNDSTTLVTESDYTNNVSAIRVRITPSAGPQAKAPTVRVTYPTDGLEFKVGKPVTITWEVAPGSTPTHQEVWFMPTPKSVAPATAVDHNDPHHDMLARARPIGVNLGPNVRSFTWIPTEDDVMEIPAQIMVRVQDSYNMVGTDQRIDGLIRVVKDNK